MEGMKTMIVIDGSYGEGGGQILRTSLALSLVTGKPFRIENIRANRKKPGLGRQHLTAVNAAVEIGQAEVKGNSIGSLILDFAPETVKPGKYHFAIGTAGSCTLVLQAILPALLMAEGKSELTLEGGTHNPLAPTFDFLNMAFFPVLHRMGANVTAALERPGFYPAGGGKFSVSIEPTGRPARIDLLTRGNIEKQTARAVVSKLPKSIGEREINVIRGILGWDRHCLCVEEVKHPVGPGNVLTAIIECEQITEVFTGFGERGVPAEKVASRIVIEIQEYLNADVPVGRHLADQLIIPVALAGGGKFRTLSPSQHTTTNIEVVKQFLDIVCSINQPNKNLWEIELSSHLEPR
jgi:RNA 3'-terminal phosphate cyclase (ATP)